MPNDIKTALIEKLKNKSAMIGIVGLGYVGLPLALRYAEMGYKVIGFDIDPNKTAKLMNGVSYIGHVTNERIAQAVATNLMATCDMANVREVDALIICVPTPLTKWREPDLSFIVNTMNLVLPYLHQGQIISLESTTYPGSTEEILKPAIEAQNFIVGSDIFLVYSPEREDPGNPNFSTATIPKVCGGVTANCLEAGIALYEQIISQVVPVSSARAAEMAKLLENIHRAVNIGLVNEMKLVADKMGIDIYEVIRAAATKPFGFVAYYPGPGLGGHCIPIDPFYLTWKAREFGIHTRFIELAGEVNSAMPDWVIQKTMDALNQRKKALSDSSILVLGVAYKKNVDDMRESPSIVIMEKLMEKGATVQYSDPHVPTLPEMRQHHIHQSSVALTPEKIAEYDCVLIATAHDAFDFPMIKECARMIVDTRGVYQEPSSNVIKA